MSDLKFAGLHAHDGSSIGDGFGQTKDHFDYALNNGCTGLAISNHGNLNSAGYVLDVAEKYKKKEVPFRVIYGTEAYIHPDLDQWRHLKALKDDKDEETTAFIENERESKGKHYDPIKRRHHLVILAKNQVGLKNLFRLISKSYDDENFYRMPRMDFKMLDQHKEGLIISSACLAGIPSFVILREKEKSQEEIFKALDNEVKPLLDIFGKENAFLEIQFNKLPEQRIINDHLIEYSKRVGYDLLATVDSHYPDPNLWQARELYRLLAWQSKGMKFTKEDLPQKREELKCELYPKNGNQLFDEYKAIYGEDATPELDEIVKGAIERSHTIAHDQIEEVNPDRTYKLPSLKEDPFNKLTQLCYQKLKEKGLDQNQEYIDRLEKELEVIKIKKFALYFTTLYDALDAIQEKILIGSGRGSGTGSLACYLLGITKMDPVKHGLIFERFLAEYRQGAPDIDTDVEDKDVAFKALQEVYGEKGVVAVSNFNTLQLRSLVKDISKFYDIPYPEVNAVTTKMEEEARAHILEDIGHDQKLYEFNFENAKKYSPTFREFLENHPDVGVHVANIFKENKAISRHAGGIIICDNYEECMPAIRIRGTAQTPFTEGMKVRHLENFGLIKYDFLGLATLRFVRRCIELILIKEGIQKPSMSDVWDFYNEFLHSDKIDLKDQKVFEYVYHQGRFPGIFQFTEQGVQNFCKRAKPTSMAEIAVITGLWRPGPLSAKADKKYLARKWGDEPVIFDHPVLEEVLRDTQGLVIFQEDFMRLAHQLAGFSLEESDKLRKLLLKPVTDQAEEIKKQRKEIGEKFINGCVKNGLTKDRATELWEKEILGSISYSFSKNHAYPYAHLSYVCAWLLTYFEEEWLRSYLELDADRDKAIADASSLGYTVAKPDIMKSTRYWEIEDQALIPSLSTIKGLGEKAVDELLALRKEKPKPVDFYDFLYSTEIKTYKNGQQVEKLKWRFSKFNKTAFSAMIKLEAFESFDIVGKDKMFETYRQMYDVFIGNYDKIKRGSINLGEMAQEMPIVREWTSSEKIEFQKDLLGTFDKELILTPKAQAFFSENEIRTLESVDEYPRFVWFVLAEVKNKKTKGDPPKPYKKLLISNLEKSTRTLNYFGLEPQGGWEQGGIYVTKLHMKNGWLNVTWGQKIIRVRP